MNVRGYNMAFIAGIKYGINKGLKYRINTISWFIADIALYFSVIILYLLLFTTFSNFGGYTKSEIAVYISTYFMINNIFAVLFSEAVSEYGESVLNGSFLYYELTPCGPLKSLILLNFNYPALLSTPFLLAFNIISIAKFRPKIGFVLLYYVGICLAVSTMLFVFQLIYSMLLFGIRSQAISSSVTQLFAIAEKPDKIFNPTFRKIFTYCIPAFIFSAVPSRIIFGDANIYEIFYLFICPIVFMTLYIIAEHIGVKVYTNSGY